MKSNQNRSKSSLQSGRSNDYGVANPILTSEVVILPPPRFLSLFF